eukprot:scaffold55447_cov28-Tisochrysis_lutea.AAC.2
MVIIWRTSSSISFFHPSSSSGRRSVVTPTRRRLSVSLVGVFFPLASVRVPNARVDGGAATDTPLASVRVPNARVDGAPPYVVEEVIQQCRCEINGWYLDLQLTIQLFDTSPVDHEPVTVRNVQLKRAIGAVADQLHGRSIGSASRANAPFIVAHPTYTHMTKCECGVSPLGLLEKGGPLLELRDLEVKYVRRQEKIHKAIDEGVDGGRAARPLAVRLPARRARTLGGGCIPMGGGGVRTLDDATRSRSRRAIGTCVPYK